MSSKAASGFQRLKVRRSLILLATGGAALLLGAATEPVAVMPDGRVTPTRQPVPRWLSLKSSEVRARTGPGLDYRILWEYRAAGLPVQVIAETREWRKICDPEGSVAWVHRSVVSSRRTVFNPSREAVSIHAGRADTAALRARLSPRSVIALDGCEDGWCRVEGRNVRGWTRESGLFGVQPRALCDAARRAGPPDPPG